MKAVCYRQKAVFVPDYPKPVPAEGESLIHIRLAAVCSTDKEILRGYRPDFSGVMGHEFVGVVAHSDDPALVGRRVVGELNAGCGHCLYCRTGREKHCLSRRVIGISGKDGCFAEYMTLRTDLVHVVPDEVPDEQAVCTEPLAAALEVAEQVHIRPSRNVAVIGDGRLAYLTAQVLALQGVELTVIGRHAEKLAMFAPFARTLDRPEGSYEVVVEASGSPSGIGDALRLVRKQGQIVLKSTYAGKAEVDMSLFAVNEITLTGSRCGPFEPALQLLRRGLVHLPPIELYDLSEFEKAFASRAFKAGFRVSAGGETADSRGK